MRYLSQFITYLITICILSIQLAPLFDDPRHLMTPQPDCPICLVYETQVRLPNIDGIGHVLNLIFIVLDLQPINRHDHPIIAKITIRAPPQFSLL